LICALRIAIKQKVYKFHQVIHNLIRMGIDRFIQMETDSDGFFIDANSGEHILNAAGGRIKEWDTERFGMIFLGANENGILYKPEIFGTERFEEWMDDIGGTHYSFDSVLPFAQIVGAFKLDPNYHAPEQTQ
jgi:hypothetical protein